MATVLYEFLSSSLNTKAPNTPNKVCIKSNNAAFSDVIPKNFINQGYEDFVNFLKSHPLRYALAATPTAFYPQHVCEFYYTCVHDSVRETLTGTIHGGTRVSFNTAILRDALRLPVLDQYRPFPSDERCKGVLNAVNYDPSLEFSRAGKSVVLRQCLPAGYKYLTGVICKCLGYKVGSLDQLNQYELHLFYCMVAGREIDYAGLIFSQMAESIKGKNRPAHVTFPRFFALVLEHIGNGYIGAEEDKIAVPTSSSKLINEDFHADDLGLSDKMNEWLAVPYEAAARPYVSPVMAEASTAEPSSAPAENEESSSSEDSESSDSESEEELEEPFAVDNTGCASSVRNTHIYFESPPATPSTQGAAADMMVQDSPEQIHIGPSVTIYRSPAKVLFPVLQNSPSPVQGEQGQKQMEQPSLSQCLAAINKLITLTETLGERM